MAWCGILAVSSSGIATATAAAAAAAATAAALDEGPVFCGEREG